MCRSALWAFINSRCSSSDPPSAPCVQQPESSCTSQNTKFDSTAPTLISARYENSPLPFIFFPQMVNNFSSSFGFFSGFMMYLFQNIAEIYMLYKDPTIVHRITSHTLRSVTINQTKQDIFVCSFRYQGLSLIMFGLIVFQFDSTLSVM